MIQENSLTYDTYLKVQRATASILSQRPLSHAYFDITRSDLARQAYFKWSNNKPISKKEEKAYMANAILPVHGKDINEEDYKRLYSIYGEGTVKISMMDINYHSWLHKSGQNENILSTGGACAQESVDTKIIAKLANLPNGKTLVKEYIDQILLRFPTWTQITGALIPAIGLSVMYDETYPWYLKIAEYNIDDPEATVQRVYDNIYAGVSRYAKLHSPKNNVVKIPFIKLDLVQKGKLEKWYKLYEPYIREMEEKYKLDAGIYDPDAYFKSWIEYTYCGPDILDIDKKLIKEINPAMYDEYNVKNYTIHVRGKQIDHLDVDRSNAWMHSFILDNMPSRYTQRISSLLKIHQRRHGIAIYQWMRSHYKDISSVGFAGFLDFNYQGRLMHENMVFVNSDLQNLSINQLMEYFLDCPLRLNSRNVDETITFLNRFKSPNSISLSKEILINLNKIKKKAQNSKRKMEVVDVFIHNLSILENIIDGVIQGKDYIKSEFKSKICLDDIRQLLLKRYCNNTELNLFVKNEFGEEANAEKLIQDVCDSLDSLDQSNDTVTIVINPNAIAKPFLTKLLEIIKKHKNFDISRLDNLSNEQMNYEKDLKNAYQTISTNVEEHQNDHLTRHINILPLCDNLFVSYMQQLLFVPSIRAAYLDMAAVEGSLERSKAEKEEIVVQIIQTISPHVNECIRYVMKGGDYPWNARFESQYKQIY